MRRWVGALTVLCALASWPAGVLAQPTGGDGQRLQGLRLFNQSCRVCHTKPTLLSGMYGPALSKDTLGGNADAIRTFINNGTARMPGFKYDFTPAQIDAIVAYIKARPATAQAAPAPAKANNAPGAD